MATTAHPARTRRGRAGLALLGAAALAVTGVAGAGGASASSHREAPNISGSPRLDTTDVYAFLSPDKPGTATLIANWIPFEEPAGGPNFYTFADGAHYDIDIDTNGDAKADVIYRWTFKTKTKTPSTFLYNTGQVTSLTDPDLNIVQTYTLSEYSDGTWKTIDDDLIAAPSNTGKASFPNYAAVRNQAVYTTHGVTTFAGQADDPFFLDLRIFDLLYGANLSEVGNDTLRGYNVNSVALQVPVSELGGAKNIVGIWSETSAKNSSGDYKQVSRLGNPLVNEVVIPLKDKDKFNASKPKDDAQFLSYVTKPSVPKLLQAIYGIPAPAEPRNDLVQVFLTGVPGLNQPKNVVPSEQLRLNLTPFAGQAPSRLGVVGGDLNGFPNGRRLTDDVVDEALQVEAGVLVGHPNTLGDGVNANDVAFGSSFPYLALPHTGSDAVNTSAAAAHLVSPLQGGKPDGPSALSAASTSVSTAVLPVGTAVVGGLGLMVGLGALARRRRGVATLA